MKKALLFVLSLVFICCFALASCKGGSDVDIIINRENSFFDTFSCENDKVYIYCTLEIENKSNEAKKFTLSADFPDDKGVLLKESTIFAVDEGFNEALFELNGKEKRTVNVTFLGDYAGTYQKHDRLLPEIKVIMQ